MLTKPQFDAANPKAITSPDVFQIGETYWARHQSTVTPVVFNGFTVKNNVLQVHLTDREVFRDKRLLDDMGVVAYYGTVDDRMWNPMNSIYECERDALDAIHGPLPEITDLMWAEAHFINHMIDAGMKSVVDRAVALEAAIMANVKASGMSNEDFIDIFGGEHLYDTEFDYGASDPSDYDDEDGVGYGDEDDAMVIIMVIN